jgi:hypothetical protein
MRVCLAALFFLMALSAVAQSPESTVIFWDEGFPAADTLAPDHASLAALPNERFATAQELAVVLASSDTKLLVMPYGSAFPEDAWPAIDAYLQRGGNLLALGGRPFSQAAYRECDAKNNCAWKLRYRRNAWSKALYINDYTETAGPRGLSALGNSDLPEVTPPLIEWKHSWSPTVRMSAEGLYARIGTAGTIDMRLDALVWFRDGDNHKLAAPVIEIDHIKNNFVGGRWVLVLADLERPLSQTDLSRLAQRALEGAREMLVQPTTALFLPGEAPSFQVRVNRFASRPAALRLELTDSAEIGSPVTQSFPLDIAQYPFINSVQIPAQLNSACTDSQVPRQRNPSRSIAWLLGTR